MDEYGCLKADKESAEEVTLALTLAGSCVFPLSVGDGGCLIVHIDTTFYKIGIMPFGGNPVGRVYMGIYGRGCNHFSKDEIHPSYFKEKLNIHSSEAETLAEFWKMIWV